jgi:hypothetical protein
MHGTKPTAGSARFAKVFCSWLGALVIAFILANAAGVFRDPGLVPFSYTGFPLPFISWNSEGVDRFESVPFVVNLVVMIVTCPVIALLCTFSRLSGSGSQKDND